MATEVLAKPAAETEFDQLGIKYKLLPQFDLSKLSTDRRVQVREDGHYAPKDSVERYAVQMGHTAFPPIVVTSDNWIVDGNTRVGAALRRKDAFFPAYVLDWAWDGSAAKRRAEMVALAATLNQQNGIPLTSKEMRTAVRPLIELGWTTEQIARRVGLRGTAVTAVRREIDAENKLHRVGLSSNGSLKGASLRAFGAKDVLALNDVPFKSLAELAADAGFNASEISSAAKDARATGSDQGAVDSFTQLRTEMGDRIREHSLTGTSRPPLSRQLRQHLGFVTKFADGREQELIETDPNVSPQHIEAIQKAVSVLSAVLEMQK